MHLNNVFVYPGQTCYGNKTETVKVESAESLTKFVSNYMRGNFKPLSMIEDLTAESKSLFSVTSPNLSLINSNDLERLARDTQQVYFIVFSCDTQHDYCNDVIGTLNTKFEGET